MAEPVPPASANTININIAIVGCGVAGLRAAEVLLAIPKEVDVDVCYSYHLTVFEARNRLGGRMVTSEGVAGWEGLGGRVDLGPNWVHGTTENPLVKYLPKTTPESVCFDLYGSERRVLHIRDGSGESSKPRLALPREISDELFGSVMLGIARAEEYSKVFGKKVDKRWSLRDYLGVVTCVRYGVPWGHKNEDEAWERERQQVVEFEERFKGDEVDEGTEGIMGEIVGGQEDVKGNEQDEYSEEEKAKIFIEMAELWGAWVGEELGKQSLRWFIMEEGMEGSQAFLASTYDPLLDLLSRPLLKAATEGKARIHLNTEVTSIDYIPQSSNSQPQIRLTTAPTEGGFETHHHFSAALICLPLGVLKNTHQTFFPPTPSPLSLPPRATSAISSLGYGRLEKVYLRFEHAWWPSDIGMISFLAIGGAVNVKLDEPQAGEKPNSTPIPVPPHVPALSLSALPEPHAQPTLLFYLFGETSTGLVQALRSANSTGGTAVEKGSQAFTIVESFFAPYLSRLQVALGKEGEEVPRPTHIIHTAWSADPLAGFGSYTQFPVGAEDSGGDVRILKRLGGRRLSWEGSGSGDEERGKEEEEEVKGERAWDGVPVWLAGEYVAPRKGLGTVAGAWWSGGEKGERVRKWFEGGVRD